MNEVSLTLRPEELAATVEALYDALMRRMKWTLHRDVRMTPDGWGDLAFETAQEIINQLSASLAKAMMVLREYGDLHPEFEEMFTPSQDVWDLIAQVTLAGAWEEAPVHPRHSSCDVCRRLSEV